MVDKEVFANCVQEIALAQGLKASADWMKVIYKFVGSEFDNEGFRQVCINIMKNEELYGKMPTPRHFTKYLPKQITADEQKEANKQAFLEKVSDYLMLGFVTDYDRSQFTHLTELESRTLRANGGLAEMWGRVHNPDYPAKISTIIKELNDFYDNNYTRESVEERLALTDNRSGGMKSLGDSLSFLEDLRVKN